MDIGVAMLGQGFMGRAHALAIGRVATFEGLALRPIAGPAPHRDVYALLPPGGRHALAEAAVLALAATAETLERPAA